MKKKLRSLEHELNALGAVNPNAPQEYADLQQRHGFLSGNAEDLEKAKADLMQLIGEMEATMTKQFREAFLKINDFFGEIFVQLFGGGQAKIQLTDKENVLESGVNIMVTRMASNSTAIDTLESLNVKIWDSKGNFIGLKNALIEINKQLDTKTPEESAEYIAAQGRASTFLQIWKN